MGYKVIASKDETDMMRTRYSARKGLEGPFMFAGGRVLYYDTKEGKYYDPTCDWYVEQDEIWLLQNQLMDILRKV